MKTKEQKHLVALALTSPLLLTKKQRKNPFEFIEQFFSFTSLGGFRQELNIWFRHASIEGSKHKNVSNLLFVHTQLLQLIDAGYLIVSNKTRYEPKPQYSGKVFSEWRNSASHEKEKHSVDHFEYSTPYWLKIKHRENPIEYIRKTLKIETIAYIRMGLKEWQEAASSKYLSLEGIGSEYSFQLYELLQTLVEAFYLVLMSDMKLNRK